MYTLNNIRELTAGTCFVVTGTILPICDRFEVNLLLNNSDIALHFNPRFSTNIIVYNSLNVKSGWEDEEYSSLIEFNLQRKMPFILHILVTNDSFLISVNGRHCHEFQHRRPYRSICKLEVKGGVEDVAAQQSYIDNCPLQRAKFVPQRTPQEQWQEVASRPPPPHLEGRKIKQMPYTGALQVPFTSGQKLHVIGCLNAQPDSFSVNLQTSPQLWPQPYILFHLNPRFKGEHVIVCNSRCSRWNQEERSNMPCNLHPGKKFYLRIDCTAVSYKVMLNGYQILEFLFRDNPRLVNAVHVQGDIELYDVAVETASTPSIGWQLF